MRAGRGQACGHIDAGTSGHLDVEEKQVGLEFAGLLHGLDSAFGLAHDLDVGMSRQELAQAGAGGRFIVGDQGADHRGISIHTSVSVQLNYAWQALQRAVDLYVELPLVIPVRVSGTAIVSPGHVFVAGNSGPDVFFTPGVRLKFSPESRVSFYGAAGFGIASFSGGSQGSGRENSPAFEFGGGVDIRLTRLLSLRGDVRDFVTRAGLGETMGRHHGIFQVGMAFHF